MFKELAKFFSGVIAWEAIAHILLGVSEVLAITLWGITITPKFNTIQIIIPALVSAILTYYGWFKNH
jgi:hypothetical protein